MTTALSDFAGYQRRVPPYADGRRLVFPVTLKVRHGVAARGAIVHMIERAAGTIEADRIRYAAWWLCGLSCSRITLLPGADLPGAAICRHCPAGAAGIFVYVCRAADDSPVYAGFTNGLGGRLKNHSWSAPWWPEVARVTRTEYPTIAEARAAERQFIRDEKPPYNRQWVEAS